jgi:hypothetical protein
MDKMAVDNSDITEIDDYRPHVVLNDTIGRKTHVAPVEMLKRIARGELQMSDCDDCDSMARVIVQDWLNDRDC